MEKQKLDVVCYKIKRDEQIIVVLKDHEQEQEMSYIVNYSGNGRVEVEFIKNILIDKILSPYMETHDLDINVANIALFSDLKRVPRDELPMYIKATSEEKIKIDAIFDFVNKENVNVNKNFDPNKIALLHGEIDDPQISTLETHRVKVKKQAFHDNPNGRCLMINAGNLNYIVEKYGIDGRIISTELLNFNTKKEVIPYFKELKAELDENKINIEVNFKHMAGDVFFKNEIAQDETRVNQLIDKFGLFDIVFVSKLPNKNRDGFYVYHVGAINMASKRIYSTANIVSDGSEESTRKEIIKKIKSIVQNKQSDTIRYVHYNNFSREDPNDLKTMNLIGKITNFDESKLSKETRLNAIVAMNKKMSDQNISFTHLNKTQQELSDLVSVNVQPDETTLKIYSDASLNTKLVKSSTFGVIFRKPCSDRIAATLSGKINAHYNLSSFDAETLGIYMALKSVNQMIGEERLGKIKQIEICCDNLETVKLYNNMICERKRGELNNKFKDALALYKSINKKINIKVRWIKGHSLNVFNAESDRMAASAKNIIMPKKPNNDEKQLMVRKRFNYIDENVFQIKRKKQNKLSIM